MNTKPKVVLEPGIAQKLQLAINRNDGCLEDVEWLCSGNNFQTIALLRLGASVAVEISDGKSKESEITPDEIRRDVGRPRGTRHLSDVQRQLLKIELDKLKVDSGLTYKALAERFDVSVSTLSFWTAIGTTKQLSPGRKSLCKIASFYRQIYGGKIDVALLRFAKVIGFPERLIPELVQVCESAESP